MTTRARTTILSAARRAVSNDMTLREAQEYFDTIYLTDVLRTVNGNKTAAAKISGFTRYQIIRLVKKGNVPRSDVLFIDVKQDDL